MKALCLYGRLTIFVLKPNLHHNQSLTVTLDALKHIFQSDFIIIDNEGSLFTWETYRFSPITHQKSILPTVMWDFSESSC